MTQQADKVSWFEMPADDVQRVSEFYRKVFGWKTPPMGEDATFALTVKADETATLPKWAVLTVDFISAWARLTLDQS